jgi:hypothetical protein
METVSEFMSDVTICPGCGCTLEAVGAENDTKSLTVHGECEICESKWKFNLTVSEE